MALAGFSNESFCSLTEPQLTSVDQCCEPMGQAAMHLLLEMVQERTTPWPPRKIVIQPRLMTRESSRAGRGSGGGLATAVAIGFLRFLYVDCCSSEFCPGASVARAVRDYLLFVDTETSGIPRDWNKPYSSRDNWPHIAQLAWVVYTPEGQEVKAENHYIQPSDYDMSPQSGSVHGLTLAFLQEHGKLAPRRDAAPAPRPAAV